MCLTSSHLRAEQSQKRTQLCCAADTIVSERYGAHKTWLIASFARCKPLFFFSFFLFLFSSVYLFHFSSIDLQLQPQRSASEGLELRKWLCHLADVADATRQQVQLQLQQQQKLRQLRQMRRQPQRFALFTFGARLWRQLLTAAHLLAAGNSRRAKEREGARARGRQQSDAAVLGLRLYYTIWSRCSCNWSMLRCSFLA